MSTNRIGSNYTVTVVGGKFFRYSLELAVVSLALVIPGLIGCGSDEGVILDLREEAARVRQPSVTLRFDAEKLRTSGGQWWKVERPKTGEPFVWAGSKSVSLDIDLDGGRPFELSFRCRPYSWPGASVQEVGVVLNDVVMTTLELRPGMETYSVSLPARQIAHGSNRLEFRFDHVGRPMDCEEGSVDRRTLAVAFEFLALDAGTTRGSSKVWSWVSRWTEPALVTFVGNPTVVSTRAARGSFLDLEAKAGVGPVQAEAWVRIGDRPKIVVAGERLEEGTVGRWRVDLSEFAGYVVAIGLGAVSTEGAPPGAAVEWTRAEVVSPPGVPVKPSNVILIVVDTLRPDYLSVFGGPARSPHIDDLMMRGARFPRAYSHIPITGPSHSSIFTSMLPSQHGVHNNAQVLSQDVTTMAEIFKDAGYTTAAFVSLGVLKGRFGFSQGFDHYDDDFQGDWMRNAEQVNRVVFPWIESRDSEPFFLWVHYSDPHEPYAPPNRTYPGVRLMVGETEVGRIEANGRGSRVEFDVPPGSSLLRLVADEEDVGIRYRFVHFAFSGKAVDFRLGDGWDAEARRFGSPVFNSTLPASLRLENSMSESVRTAFNLTCKEVLPVSEIRNRYVAEIEYLDFRIGELLGTLEKRGFLEDSLLIFVGDHGEGLGDHNHIGHISQLYDTLIRVPLSFSCPGHIKAGTVVDRRVGLIDLLPTALDAVGIAIPRGLHGRSLMPDIEGRGEAEGPPVIAMTFRPEAASDKRAIILDDSKYIHSLSDREWEELYDLRVDPAESTDLAGTETGRLNHLREELLKRLLQTSGGTVENADLTDDDRARLRELGYIH
jgi:arylsulfatase A-like enzyme